MINYSSMVSKSLCNIYIQLKIVKTWNLKLWKICSILIPLILLENNKLIYCNSDSHVFTRSHSQVSFLELWVLGVWSTYKNVTGSLVSVPPVGSRVLDPRSHLYDGSRVLGLGAHFSDMSKFLQWKFWITTEEVFTSTIV